IVRLSRRSVNAGQSVSRVAIRLLSSGSQQQQQQQEQQQQSRPPLHRDPELAQLLGRIASLDLAKLTPETRALLDRIVRVDHAGEFGADRIYAGQLAVLGGTPTGPLIRHMHEQEQDHLAAFEALIPALRARPTVLMPFWRVAGFALGAGTALIGKEAAMACTVAVEAEIQEHYNAQLRSLLADNPELHADLMRVIARFRDEEAEHHDTGLREDAESAPAYPALSAAIRAGCRVAIFLSERI
ncbi:hypothetical protein BOX15_Mlig014096g2, partial [Macrostomum lignano]